MSELETTATMHPIFTKDPQTWVSLVHKLIEVTTEDDQHHRGYVYTIDPVSESIILLNPTQTADSSKDFSSMSLKLLPGGSVTDVTVLSEDIDPDIKVQFDRLFRPVSSKTLSAEQLNNRKQRLLAWLEKHRLPVSLGPDGHALTVAGAATVVPPYREDNCLSTNEIILARVRALISDMPSE